MKSDQYLFPWVVLMVTAPILSQKGIELKSPDGRTVCTIHLTKKAPICKIVLNGPTTTPKPHLFFEYWL